MTTQSQMSIHFNVSKAHGWKDALVISVLLLVLGAFVAQISSAGKHSPGSQPVAAVAVTASLHG
jgi:hypothetical protein